MPKFRAPGEDEYTGTKYVPAQADSYVAKVESYAILEGDDLPPSKYRKEGDVQIRFYMVPESIDGDPEAEMLDINDEPLEEDKQFIFFFDPKRMGIKPRLSRSRKFLANALNIPVEQPVEYDSYEELAEDMVGRTVVVEVTVNGNYNNIVDTRPVRKRRARAEKGDLTAAAKAVFNTEDSGNEDDF